MAFADLLSVQIELSFIDAKIAVHHERGEYGNIYKFCIPILF